MPMITIDLKQELLPGERNFFYFLSKIIQITLHYCIPASGNCQTSLHNSLIYAHMTNKVKRHAHRHTPKSIPLEGTEVHARMTKIPLKNVVH